VGLLAEAMFPKIGAPRYNCAVKRDTFRANLSFSRKNCERFADSLTSGAVGCGVTASFLQAISRRIAEGNVHTYFGSMLVSFIALYVKLPKLKAVTCHLGCLMDVFV